jgi:2-dehydrotetronate isomerase
MPRFAANLTMMFTEHPFMERFGAAARAGFDAVEFQFPYEHPATEIGKQLRRYGLSQTLFNLPPGDWAAGDRGLAAVSGRKEEMQRAFDLALPYIKATGTSRVHLLAGNAPPSTDADQTFRESIAWTAERLAPEGVSLMLEPLNFRDNPGYYLTDFDAAVSLIRSLSLPNLKLQFDVYHCQILHGDLTRRLEACLPLIGHVQIASVPSRHEPDGEELNFPHLFERLDSLGYDGFVGCEYRPRASTVEGLRWFTPYRASRR